MPAGKSPNNAFNLHKERMKIVLRTIREGVTGDRRELLRSAWFLRHALNELDTKLSKPSFYWKEQYHINHLFTKGYVDQYNQRVRLPGPATRGRSQARISLLIIRVREYYTDGVRPIGAME